MIKLGNLKLPLYICDYVIPSAYQSQVFNPSSNDPVIVSGYNSNNVTPQPFSIFAPSAFDYGVTTTSNVYNGNAGATFWACLNGLFVGVCSNNIYGSGSGTGYPYNFFQAYYINTGGNESLTASSPMTILPCNYSGFTGAFGPYGSYAQPFVFPSVLANNVSVILQHNYASFTGPGTGFTDAVVIGTPQGNFIAPNGNMYAYENTSFNFQLNGLTGKYNKIMGMFPSNSQWYRMDWSSYGLLASTATPINIGNTGMFTPITIDDNSALNSAFNNSSAGTNTDPNKIMTNDTMFTVVLKGVSSFSNMASTVLMIFPDKGYYINVQMIGKTAAAVAALAQQDFSVQFDRRGWFMLVNPSVSVSNIFNTVPLTVDFTFPTLPKNAINPLPCFNNAIEGLIVG